MVEILKNAQGWQVGAGGAVVLSALVSLLLLWQARVWPKDRILKVLSPLVSAASVAYHTTLGRYIKPRTLHRLDEAAIPTIKYVVCGLCDVWMASGIIDKRVK